MQIENYKKISRTMIDEFFRKTSKSYIDYRYELVRCYDCYLFLLYEPRASKGLSALCVKIYKASRPDKNEFQKNTNTILFKNANSLKKLFAEISSYLDMD